MAGEPAGLVELQANPPKENDVFPQTLESWVYLIVACVIGLFIGQWIRHRRNKTDSITQMTIPHQRKRISKKSRRESRRLSNDRK